MQVNQRTLLLFAALTIAPPVLGTIIELPTNYSRSSPWTELIELGVANYTETDCLRTCVSGDLPRVCLFTFVLENYATMGTACGSCADGVLEDCYRSQCIPADGFERGVVAINRQIPGPAIHVCQNDLIVVNVQNHMAGTEVTLHWHGLLQKNTQWMDGAPYVTQCPIGARNFRYAFPAEYDGTYFYHGHTGAHRTNGHFGALVVHAPKSEEPWSEDLYDLDEANHTIVCTDWMHELAEMFLPGLPSRQPGVRPDSILINGLGRYYDGQSDTDSVNSSTPFATFHVQTNYRYRMRLISASNHVCPFILQIQNHSLILIATDGAPIEPVTVDSIIYYPGERYDFVLDPSINVTEGDAFWIHVRGLGTCEPNKVDQYAVLSYNTSADELGILPTRTRPTVTDPLPMGIVINNPNATCGSNETTLCITDLTSIGYEVDDELTNILTGEPDVRLYIPFGFHAFDADTFHEDGPYHPFMNLGGSSILSAWMNNISFVFPVSPVLASESYDYSDNGYCDPDNLPAECPGNDTDTPYCECTHVANVQLNDIVELVFIDNAGISNLNHPIHLHGYSFYVMYTHQNSTRTDMFTVSEVADIISTSAVATTTNISVPALKDTISVPSHGYAVVRFKADNPGAWLMHCHFEWHMSVGMMMVLRVNGTVSSAPSGFPECGNFDPLG